MTPVSTGIDGHLCRVCHLSIYPGPLSLAVPPCVGEHNEYWRWFRPPLVKKRRVLRISRNRYWASKFDYSWTASSAYHLEKILTHGRRQRGDRGQLPLCPMPCPHGCSRREKKIYVPSRPFPSIIAAQILCRNPRNVSKHCTVKMLNFFSFPVVNDQSNWW